MTRERSVNCKTGCRTRAALRAIVVGIALLVTISACGRREKRAFFDAPPPPPVDSTKSAAAPLPVTAVHVQWAKAEVPALAPGATAFVTVTLTNKGDKTWPDPATADPVKKDGGYAVRVGHSWAPKGGTPERTRERADLPKPLGPGESVTLQVPVRAPMQPGDYVLTFELVQELVFWFADHGAETLSIPVRVQPPGGAASP